MHISTLLILYRDVTLVISIIKFQIYIKKKLGESSWKGYVYAYINFVNIIEG
jgi:hypothetical protein